MEKNKWFVKVQRALQGNAEGESGIYDRRKDLLVLTVETDWIVTGARAFCLGDESGGQIGRPLDSLELPAKIGEVLKSLNFEDFSGNPGFWQHAEILGKEELFDLIASPKRRPARASIRDKILQLIRKEWVNIPALSLSKEALERKKAAMKV